MRNLMTHAKDKGEEEEEEGWWLIQGDWKEEEKKEAWVDRRVMHLVMHVEGNEMMVITLLNHEMEANHDRA